jgi:hypothetical protein
MVVSFKPQKEMSMKKLFALALVMLASVVFADPEVSRHQFTSAIDSREPVDALTDAMNVNPVFYFTELTDFQDTTVIHRWSFEGKVMAEVTFNVGGPRWRVYSSKRLQPEWDGEWMVEVVDSAGVVVASDVINLNVE